jgi:hypothetical protein
MTDARDPSDGTGLAVTEALEKAAEKREDAEDLAFANKLAKRSPPNEVERAEIERAGKRTKARAPRVAGGPLDQRARPHPAVPQPPPLTAAQPKRGAIKPALRSTSFVLSLFNRSTADYI